MSPIALNDSIKLSTSQEKSLNLPPGSLPDSENSPQSGDYLDYLHKSHNFLTPHCKKYFRYGECENGHQFIKVMGCGKEWCPDCSPQRHKQRIARLWPKIYKMEAAGYLIFTIPEEMREKFNFPERLDAIQKFVHWWLSRQFPGWRGFSRWHFSGKNAEKYHPHLNVLIERGWISGDVLNQLKRLYKQELEKVSGIKIGKKVDVRYRYIENRGDKTIYLRKLYHRFKYITRPTFLVYQEDLAKKLKGYRNIRLHGWKKKTSDEDEEEAFKILEEITGIARLYEARLLHKSICPFCKAKVKWEDKVYSPRTLFLLFEDAFWVGDCGESFYYLGHKDDEVIQELLAKIFEFLERGKERARRCEINPEIA